jgi:cytochrome c553
MIKIAMVSLATTSIILASSTMCFKKDHVDPSTIESVPLNGGECKGQFSVAQMKERGYNVKDIKITMGKNGMDYMYIFAQETVVLGGENTTGGQALTKEQLKAYLYEIQEEEEIAKKKKEELGNIVQGKALYISQCAKCHGDKGEKRAYNTSKPLNTMSYDDMAYAINEYDLDERTGGMAVLMKPYAVGLTEEKLKDISSYIKSLKSN